MARKKRNPAEVVTDELGVRPLARALGVDPRIVSRWKERGIVPSQYHVEVIRVAEAAGAAITTNDLVYGRGG